MIPAPPPGYDKLVLAPANTIIAMGPADQPLLYLDEATLQWLVLDRHVSEVHPALDTSKR